MIVGGLSEQSARLLALLLNALHGLILYYDRDYKELNVDGLFGLRLIEGQLKHIWIDYEGNGGLSAQVVDDIKNLSSYAGRLANKALPHVFERDPAYFDKFKYLIDRPYDIAHAHRLVDNSLLWTDTVLNSNAAKKPFTERQSDKCFAELLSSAAEPLRQSKICNASMPCLNYMIGRKGLTQYKLTHQILYMAIAELAECTPTVEQYVGSQGSSVEKFVVEWCSNVVEEIRLIERSNSHLVGLSFTLKDLLMEQVFTCGQFGFVEVARVNMLMAFLSWQDPKLGCFIKSDSSVGSTPSSFGGRKILSEVVAKDSCSAHAGAVGAGAMTTMLRFLLDPGPERFSHLRFDAQRIIQRAIPAENKFRVYDYTKWIAFDDFMGEPPPLHYGRDFHAFLLLIAGLGLAYIVYKLFCKRRVRQLYLFAYKKL